MRELLSIFLAHVVMLGGICLALHWIWQMYLRVIGVSYGEAEQQED